MEDKGTQRTTQKGDAPARGYLHGLHASVGNNASAYGYSVTITASFGLLTTALGTPTAPEIFAFAAGAVVAFALVEAVVSGGFKHGLEDEPGSVKELGSSVSVLSVGVAMGRSPARTSENSVKKPSEKSHERAKRLAIRRLIAA